LEAATNQILLDPGNVKGLAQTNHRSPFFGYPTITPFLSGEQLMGEFQNKRALRLPPITHQQHGGQIRGARSCSLYRTAFIFQGIKQFTERTKTNSHGRVRIGTISNRHFEAGQNRTGPWPSAAVNGVVTAVAWWHGSLGPFPFFEIS